MQSTPVHSLHIQSARAVATLQPPCAHKVSSSTQEARGEWSRLALSAQLLLHTQGSCGEEDLFGFFHANGGWASGWCAANETAETAFQNMMTLLLPPLQ